MPEKPAGSGFMSPGSETLDGSVPEHCSTALLLIDVINDLEFEGGDKLAENAEAMARKLARLKRRASAAGISSIYVNDNFGRWSSDFRRLVEHCLNDGVRGEQIARMLAPSEKDYFVLKPKHSGFYSTCLELVLKHLGASSLILTGFTTDICVLFTANDAYMRDYRIHVPSDCSACVDLRDHEYALRFMERVLKADIRTSNELDLDALISARGEETSLPGANAKGTENC
jgi:nicotinamidase-related amidase